MSIHPINKPFIKPNYIPAPWHASRKRHATLVQQGIVSPAFAMHQCPDFFEMLPWICVPEKKQPQPVKA